MMKKYSKLTLLIVSLLLIAVFLLPTPARASGIEIDDSVGQGEVLNKSLVLFGTDVLMDGVINGDLIAVGDHITLNGEVNGTLVVLGNTVVLNGPVTGSVYSGAVDLELGSPADIGRDVYFIGGRIVSQETANIGRDLNVISLDASLSGTTGGNVNAMVGPITLIQAILQFIDNQGWFSQPLLMTTQPDQVIFNPQTVLLMAFGLQPIPNALLNAEETQPAHTQSTRLDTEALKAWGVPLLRTLVSLVILGLLMLWLVPAQTGWAGEQLRTRPWKALSLGLIIAVLGWVAAVLLFLIILGLAVFFYWLSMPNLGFLVGSLGLTTLGLGVTVFWLSIMYFSKIIVAYLVGKLLFKRFIPKYAQGRVLPFLTGVLIYALLASIPYLGWVISILTTLFGLGALWMTSGFRKKRLVQPVEEVPPSVQPDDEVPPAAEPDEEVPPVVEPPEEVQPAEVETEASLTTEE